MARRARAVSRRPRRTDRAPARHEGLGFALAQAALRRLERRRHARRPVLDVAVRKLQDLLSLSRGRLRRGRRPDLALRRGGVPHLHPRHSTRPRGARAHAPRVLARRSRGMSRLLQHLVTRQAERRAHASALVHGSERMTYGELEQASNRVARVLRQAGCRRGDRVCFTAPKSIAPLVWMLGILKAGAIHVPLDPASPPARLARVIESCEPHAVLAAGPVEGLLSQALSGLASRPLLGWMDRGAPGALLPAFGAADVARASGEALACDTRPDA